MLLKPAFLFGLAALLAGCQTQSQVGTHSDYPTTRSLARTTASLEELPPPARPVQLAVYAFPDLTGARKPNPDYPDESTAVTQGASAVLVHALKKAGRGQWFRVVERDGLQNLLKERELIQATQAVVGRGSSPAVAPLKFADYLLEGGVISFDNEIEAGGVGAAYLGVNGEVDYRKDMVTVALRLTAVQTGEIAVSVTSARTLYSTSIAAGLSRYVSSDLLSLSTGVTRVDPTQLAVQETIEAAVLQLIQDGAASGLWSFGTPVAAIAQPRVAQPKNPEPVVTGSLAAAAPAPDPEVVYAAPSAAAPPRQATLAPARPAPRSRAAARRRAAIPPVAAIQAPRDEGDFWVDQLRRH